MIDTLEARLESVMPERAMIDAMLDGIDAFDRYRPSLPLLQGGYTRTLLRKRSDFELVAMLWAPGSVSAIHDHGDSRCWVVVMEGALDVDNFERLDDHESRAHIVHASSLTVSRGELDHRLTWRELHRVQNTRHQSAFTLQLYSPLLAEYTVVNEHNGITMTVASLYDSIFDL